MTERVAAIVAVIGGLLVTVGAGLAYLPAGFIVAGLLVLAAGVSAIGDE